MFRRRHRSRGRPIRSSWELAFGFDLPASVASGTELCAQIFVGSGPTPVFQLEAFTPFSSCVLKSATGFAVLDEQESARLLERRSR